MEPVRPDPGSLAKDPQPSTQPCHNGGPRSYSPVYVTVTLLPGG